MRLLTHPGPVAPERSALAWGQAGPSYRLTIPEGEDLYETLISALSSEGVLSAGIVLMGGRLSRLCFMTGRPTEPGDDTPRVAAHCGPLEIACPAEVVGGNAILGRDAQGNPLIHCHAVFVDAEGVLRGGHLMRGQSIAGPGGIRAHAAALSDVAFAVWPDHETGFDIFQPVTT